MRKTAMSLFVCIVLLGLTAQRCIAVSPAEGEAAVPDETICLTSDGIRIASGDLNMKVGGYLSLRGVKYDSSNKRSNGLEVDEARFAIEGHVNSLSWRFEPDLVGADTRHNLYDLWLAWEVGPAIRLRAGQFRVALGSEFATHEFALPFAGYSFTSYLDGRYDVGVQADGTLLKDLLWYQATATIGEGYNLEGHRLTSPLYSLRLVSHPFARTGDSDSVLNGLFFGFALALLSDFDDPIIITNPLESTVVTTSDLDGDCGRWMHFEAGFHYGPFMTGVERVRGSANDVPTPGGDEDIDQLISWVWYGSWNITGEEQRWEDGGWAALPPSEGTWLQGRWEMAARYSNTDIDRDLFHYGYTDYDPSTQECRTFSLALNWYPVPHARVSLGWIDTIADDDLTTFGGTDRDSSFSLGLELCY
jgi:phosphate-selective porin